MSKNRKATTSRRSPFWKSRLQIMERVFPWVRAEFEKFAEDDTVVAKVNARQRFLACTNTGEPGVAELHRRINQAWIDLTGMPALGTVQHWREVAAAAGISPGEFEQQEFRRVIDCIVAWAIAERRSAPADQGKEDPPEERESLLLEQVLDVLTAQQGEIFKAIWNTKSRSMGFNAIASIPKAFQSSPSDETIGLALKRAKKNLDQAFLGIDLEISTAKRRAKLVLLKQN